MDVFENSEYNSDGHATPYSEKDYNSWSAL